MTNTETKFPLSDHFQTELTWLRTALRSYELLQQHDDKEKYIFQLSQMPEITNDESDAYAQLLMSKNFNQTERLALLLALVPHLEPDLFQGWCVGTKLRSFGGELSRIGKFQPTGFTLLLLSQASVSELYPLFTREHLFQSENLLFTGDFEAGESVLNARLIASDFLLDLVLYGQERTPSFSHEFPARKITSKLEWEDLVLAPATRNGLQELMVWLQHGSKLFDDAILQKKVKRGYRSLFFGPSGTGKTLTACLLGQQSGREVYRVDLSMVVSKYIGETEKNLGRIFDRAEHKNLILFFDEADALFGKRTAVSDAHDRYANQEVSFLLQRIEDFNGLVILASNLRENMDDAFTRRFESMVYFPMPKPEERWQLWQKSLPEKLAPEVGFNLKEYSDRYEMSGGAIANIVRYASLMAYHKQADALLKEDLFEGIRRELDKEGRSL